MTLENLLGLSLESVTPSRTQISRLLAAAERNLQDARLDLLSNENRFENLADYSGDLVSDAAVVACVDGGTALLADVKAWLRTEKPALL